MIGIESGRPTVCGNRFDIYEGQLLGQEAVALKLPRMRAEQDQETFMRVRHLFNNFLMTLKLQFIRDTTVTSRSGEGFSIPMSSVFMASGFAKI